MQQQIVPLQVTIQKPYSQHNAVFTMSCEPQILLVKFPNINLSNLLTFPEGHAATNWPQKQPHISYL